MVASLESLGLHKVHGEPWGPIHLHLAARLGRMHELREVGGDDLSGARRWLESLVMTHAI